MYSRILQFENILFIFVPLLIFKFGKFRIFKDSQLLNIFSIFVALDVIKLDKFREVNFLHPLNK